MPRPTLKEVAARAGVSVSTVSYALNDASTLPLSEATKARVRRIAREVGYVPNGLARSLQSQASRTIGVILGKPLTIPRYAAIAEGLSDGLGAEGYHLALLGERSVFAAVDEVRGHRLDGLVFIGHDDQGVPEDLVDAVSVHDVPFVAVDCAARAQGERYSTVDFDYALGVRQTFVHFARHGIRRVLYVRPDIDSPAAAIRTQSILEQKQLHPDISVRTVSTGVTPDILDRFDSEDHERGGHAAALAERLRRALATHAADPSETAVLCAWGTDAESAYCAARMHDPRVRVAGLASGGLSVELWPGLAYSRLPLREVGRESARLIVARIRGAHAPERVVMMPSLTSKD